MFYEGESKRDHRESAECDEAVPFPPYRSLRGAGGILFCIISDPDHYPAADTGTVYTGYAGGCHACGAAGISFFGGGTDRHACDAGL